jgi:hypothetical protein
MRCVRGGTRTVDIDEGGIKIFGPPPPLGGFSDLQMTNEGGRNFDWSAVWEIGLRTTARGSLVPA